MSIAQAAALWRVPSVDAALLRNNFAWTLAGNITYAGCQWAILLVLARLGNPEMVGQFALGLAITAPVMLFSQLQLRAIQATDATGRLFQAGDYLSLRLIATVLALSVIGLITFSAGYHKETACVVMIVALAKSCESLSDVFYGLLQQRERMARIAKSMILRGVLALLSVGLTVRFTNSIVSASITLAVVWFCLLLFYDLTSARVILRVSVRPTWDWIAMHRLLKQSLPLGAAMMLLALNANIPRYFIQQYLGERALGLFSVVASLQAAGLIVVNALGQSAAPRLAAYFQNQQRGAFLSLLAALFLGAALPGLALVLAASLAGEPILSFVFGPVYAKQQTPFVWLSISAAIWCLTSVLGFAATACQRLKFQSYALVVVTLLMTVSCSYAVPVYGLVGAAAATTIPALVALLLYSKIICAFRGRVGAAVVSTA